MSRPPTKVSQNDLKLPTSAAASAGTISSVRVDHLEPADVDDEDRGEDAEHRADGPVDRGDPVGGDALRSGGPATLGDGRRREPEARVVVHDGQDDRECHADDQEHDPIAPDADVGQHLDRRRLDQLGDDPDVHAVAVERERVERGEEAERRDEPRERRCPPQRPHDHQVDGNTDRGAEQQREREGEPRRRTRFARVVEVERAHHADRAVREVQDARTAIDEHDALRGQAVARAGTEAEDGEPQDLGHAMRFTR